MQGLVNRLATCSTDDGDNKEGETTRGHWLEHHERSASSVATLRGPKTVTACGPTAMPGRAVMPVAAGVPASAIKAHSCCDVYECMFSAIISVAYNDHCPVTI